MSDTWNVLLVEDNRADARLVENFLKKAEASGQHFTIERVERFRAAVDRLAGGGPEVDVVLLDRGLPDVDRSEAIGALRERFPALPIVVLTGLDDATAAYEAVTHGAQDYLVKGKINPESLVRVLHYAIARQRLESVVRDSEAEHRALFECNPVPIWVYDADTLAFLEVNAAAQAHYGWSREEFLRMRHGDLYFPEDAGPSELAAAAEGAIELHRTKDGREVLAQVSAHPMAFRGKSTYLVLAQDVTETQRMVATLRVSEQRYRELFERSLGLICEHALDGTVLNVNPAAAQALGYEPELLIGVNLIELVPERFRHQMPLYLETIAKQGHFTGMMTVQRRDGEWRAWRFHNRLFAEAGATPIIIGHAQDVTEEQRHEQELHNASLTDPLTGARNRRYLDYLTRIKALSHWGVVIVDLDHFKEVNDTHGHERGDQVLIGVVEFLRSQARQDDVVVRMGGDEFLVLLQDAAATTAATLAQRLATTAPEKSPCGLSLGWAIRAEDEPLERTIARADQQLYEERRRRRGEPVAAP